MSYADYSAWSKELALQTSECEVLRAKLLVETRDLQKEVAANAELRAKLKLAEVEADFAAIVVKDLEARLKLAEDALRGARLKAFEEVHDNWEFTSVTEAAFDKFLHDEIMRLRADGPRAKALEGQ